MKGFLDRVLLSGFAFRYNGDSLFPARLLKGRTAELIVTLDTPIWYYKWIYRMPDLHQMRKVILGFCGIKTTRTSMFGPLITSSPQKRARWLAQVNRAASRPN